MRQNTIKISVGASSTSPSPGDDDDVKIELDAIDYSTVDEATFWSSVDVQPTPLTRPVDRVGGGTSSAPSSSAPPSSALSPSVGSVPTLLC